DKDDCGRLVEGFREDEAWNRRGCAERPASLRRENFGGGSAGDGTESGCGTESGRGKQSCLGMGEEKKTSARKESDLGRDLLSPGHGRKPKHGARIRSTKMDVISSEESAPFSPPKEHGGHRASASANATNRSSHLLKAI
ncbi:unnamed protein product, partial [Pylaiella littoralis]